MNTIDIVLGVILLFGLIRGFLKGFFIELASLLALVLGIYGAIHFSEIIQQFLSSIFSWEERYMQLLSFALTFILIVVVISILGKLLTKLFSLVALGMLNRIAGAVFGLFKMILILSLLLLFFGKLDRTGLFFDTATTESSLLYTPVKKFIPTVVPTALEWAKENQWIEEKSTYFEEEQPLNQPEPATPVEPNIEESPSK